MTAHKLHDISKLTPLLASHPNPLFMDPLLSSPNFLEKSMISMTPSQTISYFSNNKSVRFGQRYSCSWTKIEVFFLQRCLLTCCITFNFHIPIDLGRCQFHSSTQNTQPSHFPSLSSQCLPFPSQCLYFPY